MRKTRLYLILLILIIFAAPAAVIAAPAESSSVESIKEELQTNINIVWTCIAAFLVFFMQAGFAMVEAGFTRAKNAVNILMKNLMDFSVGTIAFFLIGFGLMFGKTNGLFGTTLFGLSGVEPGADWNWTFLIFQTVFAATAATIVSGAMAERTKFVGYLVYSVDGWLWQERLFWGLVSASTDLTENQKQFWATTYRWRHWVYSSSGSAGSASIPAVRQWETVR